MRDCLGEGADAGLGSGNGGRAGSEDGIALLEEVEGAWLVKVVGVVEERGKEEEEDGHADIDVVDAVVVVVVGQSHGSSSMMETNRVSARGRRVGVRRTISLAGLASLQRTDT